MLTFRFTGSAGIMTESEILVSGMVGKQVRFEFSEEWNGLNKTAVYRAGPVICTSEDIGSVDIIPEKVLAKALWRLYVGVCGTDTEGKTVIPTMFVPGPFIHIGVEEDTGPEYDPEDPKWADVMEALGETVRFVPQTLTQEQQAQARANIGVTGTGGLSEEAAALLIGILKKAIYEEDVSGEILALEEALAVPEIPQEPEIPEEPEEPETVYYSLSCNLSHVTARPASAQVEAGQSCTVTLTAETGYVLSSVTVTMGGEDVTSAVYSGGTVTIGAVTGNVVVTAKAVAKEPEVTEVAVTLSMTMTSATNNQRKTTVGQPYYNTLVPEDGYMLDSVAVMMGDAYITETAVKGDKISIEKVTGAIMIIAVSVPEPVVTVSEIIMGSTSFVEGFGLQIHRVDTMTHRATVVPEGQYLKKGKTYRFGLGNASAGYSFGVQIMVASAPGLVFNSTPGIEVYHNTVTSREVDTGWMQTDYLYTPTEDNRIFTMNFKHESVTMDETNYQELLENVVIEEVTA